MLLLHQTGSAKIGEVVRYTVTYSPSLDRILPSPEVLYLRIRNTSTIALRAAFVHGPYALSVAAYPSHYDPSTKFLHPRKYGVPEFEPMLKAGGSWNCHLVVPADIRQSAGDGARHGYFGGGPAQDDQSVSWIIEIASQVIFSASAAVHFEVLVARDEKSLSPGSVPVLGGQAQVPQPGKVSDYQIGRDGKHPDQPRGVFSRAVRLRVEDTAALWNKPPIPGWDGAMAVKKSRDGAEAAGISKTAEALARPDAPEGTKKVHLVVLTHGLHGNLGGDLLYLKESIDGAVRQAKMDRRARKEKERAAKQKDAADPADGGDEEDTQDAAKSKDKAKDEAEAAADEDDEEEVVVRGFSGNATKTERGIKFLGKRLARYILSMTYPDQPFLPSSKATHTSSSKEGKPAHKGSTVHRTPSESHRSHKITSISFIGHSLGGLVQTYAIAYIQKHSPHFFDIIRPINFICLASPLLGLNHENPLYVKFALDFGLVGRTGQDLGLTWRAPTIARSGWGAIVGNLGENAHKRVVGEEQPESKPLLRILPTGPAHRALTKFRNRTVYSNVVNDGIVPLRTSCLLFLDWQGIGRVEKARREAGLVESVVGFGWAELTGANVTTPRLGPWAPEGEKNDSLPSGRTTPGGHEHDAREVPQPSSDAMLDDDRASLRTVTTPYHEGDQPTSSANNVNPFTGFFNFFKNIEPNKPPPPPNPKQSKIFQRSQTLKMTDSGATISAAASSASTRVTSGSELTSEESEGVSAPPRTTFFESATDLMNPKLPSVEYLIDPSKRPRTIFHDRIYHPSDIPPAPLKKRPAAGHVRRRSNSKVASPSSAGTGEPPALKTRGSDPYPPSGGIKHEDSMASTRDYDDTGHTNPDKEPDEMIDSSNMKVEEKIARAYHRGLSWRKVLVKLEPDAHNNMIVRRMFANAFGWPVVKHIVDVHFSDAAAAKMRDDEETGAERAKAPDEAPDEHGAETAAQTEGLNSPPTEDEEDDDDDGEDGDEDEKQAQAKPLATRMASDVREAADTVPDLPDLPGPAKPLPAGAVGDGEMSRRPNYERIDSVMWSDGDWADSDDSDGDDEHLAYGGKSDEHGGADKDGKAAESSGSPASASGGWNWTEKIVGKGATERRRSKSPQGSGVTARPDDVD